MNPPGPVLVLDAGVLDRVESDHELRNLVAELLRAGMEPQVPTVVLAEVVTGTRRDAPIDRLVKRIGTVDTRPPVARLAGALRTRAAQGSSARIPGGIDALVAAHALAVGRGMVLTTDPRDLRRLLADHPRIAVEKA